MVVLAVDIGSNRPTHRDRSCPWGNGDKPAQRKKVSDEFVNGNTRLHIDDSSHRIETVNGVVVRHVEDQTAGVLCAVAVASA